MPATPTTAHEAPPTQQPLPGLADRAPESRDSHSRSRRHTPARPAHPPTDDEILGLDTTSPRSVQTTFDFDEPSADTSDPARGVIPSEARNLSSDSAQSDADPEARASNSADESSSAEPPNFRGIFEANPELRQAWQDAQAYRETFATPEAARAATDQLADLDRMDASSSRAAPKTTPN